METMRLVNQIGATPGGEIKVTLANDQRLHVQRMAKNDARYGSGFPITDYVGSPVEIGGDWYFPVIAIPKQSLMPVYFRHYARDKAL